MKVDFVKDKLPDKFYSIVRSRFESFNPPQEKAIKAGLLDGKNLIVCAPTASGKTLIAEMAMLNQILSKGGKAIYTVPLKALATEKFNDFRERYESLGVRVALSIGDLDGTDNYLSSYDIIICSNEKLDSLIRHHADWLPDVSIVVIDEIHLLNEVNRGPTLEVLITMLRELLHAQFIGLSATIGNPEELADWLDAKLIKDSWRPVKLYEGIKLHNKVDFFGEKKSHDVKEVTKDSVLDLALDTINAEKQALVFVNTKKSAESVAEKLSLVVQKQNLNPDKLEKESKKILHSLSFPTKQCRKLSDCVKNGVAFHHSGLSAGQRSEVETSFKERKIKIICCTTTLALGLDFPSDRVIVRDLKRFSGYSTTWIPVLEMKQFIGRAGRPSYHTEGEAICIAKTDAEKEEIYDHYIQGEPEEIYSKLAVEPVLRMYILSLVAIAFARTREKLSEFFEKTFWAFQYGDIEKIEAKLDRILNTLKKFNFIIEKDGKLQATNLGMRVSQLYIDPITAHHLIKCIENAAKNGKLSEIGMMQAISETREMKPLLRVRQSEYEEVQEELLKVEELLYSQPDFVDEFFLDSFKTALMFKDWLNERGEERILEKYKVRPGELMVKRNNADWLLYSFEQLALLLGKKELLGDVAKLRVRLKYGVKEELLALLIFKNIGRVRSRLLFNAGVKDRRAVREAGLEKLSLILRSKEIAKQLKEQVEIKQRPSF